MLHTVNKSPFEKTALDSCLRLATAGSAVLLIEDGVYAALQGTSISQEITEKMKDISFYVLSSDVDARGLSDKPLIDGIRSVDYGGFVDLVTEHEASTAWL